MSFELSVFTLIPLLFLVLIFLTYHLHSSERSRAKSIEENLALLNQNLKTLTEKLEKI